MRTPIFKALVAFAMVAGCSSAPKKTPELNKMVGQKVALVEIEGPTTSRAVVETALVNQLLRRGTFILVPKGDVEAAKKDPALSPTDWKGLAGKTGADFALRAQVLVFDATVQEGYSSEQVEDSQLEEELGDGKSERLYKTRSLNGEVQIQLDFTNLKTQETRSGIAEEKNVVTSEGRDSAAHLPPKLRFLENLSNEAFRKFFERYTE